MFIMQVLASQLHFLANKNAELAIPPLFWPVNCIKIGGHVAMLSDPTVYSLYCDSTIKMKRHATLKTPQLNYHRASEAESAKVYD